MGMDVYGIKPKNEQGEYFRSNVWYWHPLWDCLDQLHPTLCSKCESPHDNSGSGLNARDSLALSKLLKEDLQDGTIDQYIKQYQEALEALPLEDCRYCDGKGTRSWPKEDGTEEVKQCNSCNGTLKTKSHLTWYNMDLDLIKEFQVFLENCGGFQIC
jgi:NAD-dependent SIR2 family protein deacetylase